MLTDAGLTHMVLTQDWHQTFQNMSTCCCSVFLVTHSHGAILEILLHLAFQNNVSFPLSKIFAELGEEFCVKLIVIGAYNGIIDMNCENDFMQCCNGPLHIPYTLIARNVWLENSR